MFGGFLLLVIIAVLVIAAIATYNGLVVARNRTDEAWSDIDVQLKRRHDLIPNLVETVKGYATHEREAFEKVTAARAAAIGANGATAAAQAENMLTDALKSLFAVAEAYPDLKASQNFVELQRELADTENKIQASRRFYNSAVMDLNTKIDTIPTNIFAGMFKFTKRDFFQTDEKEKEVVPVKF